MVERLHGTSEDLGSIPSTEEGTILAQCLASESVKASCHKLSVLAHSCYPYSEQIEEGHQKFKDMFGYIVTSTQSHTVLPLLTPNKTQLSLLWPQNMSSYFIRIPSSSLICIYGGLDGQETGFLCCIAQASLKLAVFLYLPLE